MLIVCWNTLQYGEKTVVTEQKDIQNIPHAARCRIDELKCYPYSW